MGAGEGEFALDGLDGGVVEAAAHDGEEDADHVQAQEQPQRRQPLRQAQPHPPTLRPPEPPWIT